MPTIDDYIDKLVEEKVQIAIDNAFKKISEKKNRSIQSYNQRETAKLLGMSEPMLIEERKKGMIRAWEKGVQVMYTQDEIEKYQTKKGI